MGHGSSLPGALLSLPPTEHLATIFPWLNDWDLFVIHVWGRYNWLSWATQSHISTPAPSHTHTHTHTHTHPFLFSVQPFVRTGLPWWFSGKEPTWESRRHNRRCGFYPWVRKIPWERKWQPTPVFLPEKSHDRGARQVTACGVTNSRTRLSDWVPHYVSYSGLLCAVFYNLLINIYHSLNAPCFLSLFSTWNQPAWGHGPVSSHLQRLYF